MQLECVGAIAADPLAINSETLTSLLSCPVAINSQGDFVGKPGTRLYATQDLVLKRPCDESMSAAQAIQWCQKQLERERRVGGYHPSRTWVAFCKQHHWAVANITPRLPTLEQQLQGSLPSSDKLDLLIRMLVRFFDTYAHSDTRQDEGLRNYVVDDGEVWYIDDDLYGHDNLMTFSVSLGSYVRALNWLNATSSYYLGNQLRQFIADIDDSLVESVYKGLADTFLPHDKERIRQALLRGLCPRKKRKMPELDGRLAILADIHANLPALKAVLADCKERNLTTGLVLGDIVGYGPSPGECVDLIRDSGFHVVMGNHDQAAFLGKTTQGLSRAASWSAPWTYQALDDVQRSWLGELPRYYQNPNFYAVHGAPRDPTFMNAYVYERTAQSNLDYMTAKGIRLCLHGHSHLPGVWHRDLHGDPVFSRQDHYDLKQSPEAMICPGSIGQPRDGNTAAQYLILDLDNQCVQFIQVDYDHQALISRMEQMGFPDYVIRIMDPRR